SLSHNDGDPFFGPVSNTKGRLEFNRLVRVFNSIKREGQRVDKQGIENIQAICLYDARFKLARYFIVAGQHRVAALSALGYEEIVIQLALGNGAVIVRRDEAAYWPTVQAGFYSQEEALE